MRSFRATRVLELPQGSRICVRVSVRCYSRLFDPSRTSHRIADVKMLALAHAPNICWQVGEFLMAFLTVVMTAAWQKLHLFLVVCSEQTPRTCPTLIPRLVQR